MSSYPMREDDPMGAPHADRDASTAPVAPAAGSRETDVADRRLASYGEAVWNASRLDEGTISATGANVVARAVMALADVEVAAAVEAATADLPPVGIPGTYPSLDSDSPPFDAVQNADGVWVNFWADRWELLLSAATTARFVPAEPCS